MAEGRAVNHCPHCGQVMSFVGIRDRASAWERWDIGPCGMFIVSDGLGGILGVTREEPKKGYFNGEREK